MCVIGSRKGSQRRRRKCNVSVADELGTLDAPSLGEGLWAQDLGWPDRVQQVACTGFPWPGTGEGDGN